jgi:membrane-bound lytic murein transglycosylase B
MAGTSPAMTMVRAALVLLLCCAPAHADSFAQFLQSTWPDAQKLGVSRATFDAAIKNLEPDLSLPDLHIPGRKEQPPGQAEFVLTPHTSWPGLSRPSTTSGTSKNVDARHKAGHDGIKYRTTAMTP